MWPSEEFRGSRTLRKKQAGTTKKRLGIKATRDTLDSPVLGSMLNKKAYEGLAMWAAKKMGRDFRKYLDQADRNFWTLVYLAVMVHGKDYTTALEQTPFDFPLEPTQKQTVPFDLSTFIQIKREYDRLLPAIQTIKGKNTSPFSGSESFPGRRVKDLGPDNN